jgi:hypothetical protein
MRTLLIRVGRGPESSEERAVKKIEEMTDEEKADFARKFDDALLPLVQLVEAAVLEMVCWAEMFMAACANAIAPPFDWLFEN